MKKSHNIKAMDMIRRRAKSGAALTAILLAASFSPVATQAANLPVLDEVAAGAVASALKNKGKTLELTQTTDKAILNWDSFDIAAGYTVKFIQPHAAAIALNRVTGNSASLIQGTLSANGNVWLLNSNGILFGATAKVNVGGLLATTADIQNADFLDQRIDFLPVNSAASVVNEGKITVDAGGLLALVAPTVRNSGQIVGKLNKITLAGADAFTVDFYGDGLIQLKPSTLTHLSVANSGSIKANGSHIVLSVAQAQNVLDSVINTSGIIESKSVIESAGVIELLGDKNTDITLSGSINVATTARHGQGLIRIDGGRVRDLNPADEATLTLNNADLIVRAYYGVGAADAPLKTKNIKDVALNVTKGDIHLHNIAGGTGMNVTVLDGTDGNLMLQADSEHIGHVLATPHTLTVTDINFEVEEEETPDPQPEPQPEPEPAPQPEPDPAPEPDAEEEEPAPVPAPAPVITPQPQPPVQSQPEPSPLQLFRAVVEDSRVIQTLSQVVAAPRPLAAAPRFKTLESKSGSSKIAITPIQQLYQAVEVFTASFEQPERQRD